MTCRDNPHITLIFRYYIDLEGRTLLLSPACSKRSLRSAIVPLWVDFAISTWERATSTSVVGYL